MWCVAQSARLPNIWKHHIAASSGVCSSPSGSGAGYTSPSAWLRRRKSTIIVVKSGLSPVGKNPSDSRDLHVTFVCSQFRNRMELTRPAADEENPLLQMKDCPPMLHLARAKQRAIGQRRVHPESDQRTDDTRRSRLACRERGAIVAAEREGVGGALRVSRSRNHVLRHRADVQHWHAPWRVSRFDPRDFGKFAHKFCGAAPRWNIS